MAMTPMQLADELDTFKVSEHTPQLNPSRKGLQDIALGRVKIEYGGKSKIVCPASRSPRAMKRFLIRLVDPNLNLNACRSGRAKQAVERVIAEAADVARRSLKKADVSKMEERVVRAERKKIQDQRRAFVKQAHEAVRSAFQRYHEVLDEGIISELWKEAVVKGVLES